MNTRKSRAIRAGLKLSPRVTVPRDRYVRCVRAIRDAGAAEILIDSETGCTHNARIAQALQSLTLYTRDAALREADPLALAAWVRRHRPLVRQVLAEARGHE